MTFTTTQTLDQKSAARSMPSEEAHPTAKPYDGPLARERGYRTFSGSYFAYVKESSLGFQPHGLDNVCVDPSSLVSVWMSVLWM